MTKTGVHSSIQTDRGKLYVLLTKKQKLTKLEPNYDSAMDIDEQKLEL